METGFSKAKIYAYLEGIFFLLCSLALIAYSLSEHYAAHVEWKQSPYLFPLLIAFFLLPLSLALLRQAHSLKKDSPNPEFLFRDTVIVGGMTLLYIVIMPYITFIIATILLLIGLFLYLGERRYVLIGVLSVGFTLIIYAIFDIALHVMLP